MCMQVASERVQKEWNQLNEKSQKLHRDLEDQVKVNQQLAAQNQQRQTELRLKDEQITELKVGHLALRSRGSCVSFESPIEGRLPWTLPTPRPAQSGVGCFYSFQWWSPGPCKPWAISLISSGPWQSRIPYSAARHSSLPTAAAES